MNRARTATLHPGKIGVLIALVNQDRLSEAEYEARTLIAIHPDVGMLWKILSVALVRQGKDALPALQKTVELLPQDAEAHGNLGAALHDQGQWAAALTSLHRALEIQPGHVDSWINAGNAMQALGRAREAVDLYQRALQLNPQQAEARNNLGNAFLQLGGYAEAAECYQLALGVKPDDAQIQCNLGNVLRLLGRLDESIAASERAVALDPALIAAHDNLGLALATQGQRERAAAAFRQALTLDADHVEAMVHLADVLRDLGERREALSHYARAAALRPARADIYCKLGNSLFELRRFEEALAAYVHALALEPRNAPAHLSLGILLRQQRRPDEAEASCRAALAIEPNYVEALSLLGELKADRGRFAEAEDLFRRTIAINPDYAFGYSSIATHRKMTAGDAEWRKGAQSLLEKRLPLGDEISLHYALGKYFDDVGQYVDAFGHYRQANELTKRYGSSYDPAKFNRRVDAIIGSFDVPFMNSCRHTASASEQPIFVVGMPRSGTSLTEQILASHPAVFGAGEVTFWDHAATQVMGAMQGGGSAERLVAEMAGDYLRRLTASSGTALRIVDKMPANFLYAGLIHAAFPRARIIHMQRHPIDTCLSIYFQNFFNMGPYANDLGNLAHFYGEYIRITRHWREVLPTTTLLEVPYEGLIQDQEGWTRRMLEFVGLPWDPRCLDFHRTERVVVTASKWQVRQKIHTASAGRWKHYQDFIGPLSRLPDLLLEPSTTARARHGD